MNDAMKDLLAKLDRVRKSSDGWSAQCPSHEDRKSSLSVAIGDRKILLYCHAGCTVESVCAAMGIKMSGLFVTNRSASPPTCPHAKANSKRNNSVRSQSFEGTEADVERMQCDLVKNGLVQAYIE